MFNSTVMRTHLKLTCSYKHTQTHLLGMSQTRWAGPGEKMSSSCRFLHILHSYTVLCVSTSLNLPLPVSLSSLLTCPSLCVYTCVCLFVRVLIFHCLCCGCFSIIIDRKGCVYVSVCQVGFFFLHLVAS